MWYSKKVLLGVWGGGELVSKKEIISSREHSAALLTLIVELFPRRYILAEDVQYILNKPVGIKNEFKTALIQAGHRFCHPTPERIDEWNRRIVKLMKMETRDLAIPSQVEKLVTLFCENFPYDELPEDAVTYLLAHGRELPELLHNIIKRSVRLSRAGEIKEDWHSLFGFIIGEGDFSEKNFPLEPDSEIKVFEFSFNKTIRGKKAFEIFTSKNMSCGIRSCGKYIQTHEQNLVQKSLVALVPWKNPRDGQVYVPVFSRPERKILVDLRSLDCLFSAACNFLVQKTDALKTENP